MPGRTSRAGAGPPRAGIQRCRHGSRARSASPAPSRPCTDRAPPGAPTEPAASPPLPSPPGRRPAQGQRARTHRCGNSPAEPRPPARPRSPLTEALDKLGEDARVALHEAPLAGAAAPGHGGGAAQAARPSSAAPLPSLPGRTRARHRHGEAGRPQEAAPGTGSGAAAGAGGTAPAAGGPCRASKLRSGAAAGWERRLRGPGAARRGAGLALTMVPSGHRTGGAAPSGSRRCCWGAAGGAGAGDADLRRPERDGPALPGPPRLERPSGHSVSPVPPVPIAPPSPGLRHRPAPPGPRPRRQVALPGLQGERGAGFLGRTRGAPAMRRGRRGGLGEHWGVRGPRGVPGRVPGLTRLPRHEWLSSLWRLTAATAAPRVSALGASISSFSTTSAKLSLPSRQYGFFLSRQALADSAVEMRGLICGSNSGISAVLLSCIVPLVIWEVFSWHPC